MRLSSPPSLSPSLSLEGAGRAQDADCLRLGTQAPRVAQVTIVLRGQLTFYKNRGKGRGTWLAGEVLRIRAEDEIALARRVCRPSTAAPAPALAPAPAPGRASLAQQGIRGAGGDERREQDGERVERETREPRRAVPGPGKRAAQGQREMSEAMQLGAAASWLNTQACLVHYNSSSARKMHIARTGQHGQMKRR